MLKSLGFMRSLDIVVGILLVIGGFNWGLVGLFGFNLVESVFSTLPWLSRIIYILVGLSAIYEIFLWKTIKERWHCTWTPKVETPA